MDASVLASKWCKSRYGSYWRGKLGHDELSSGLAWSHLADLSTEPFGALCWVLKNPDAAAQAKARSRGVGRGSAGHGMDCESSTGGYAPSAALFEGRHGSTWYVQVCLGEIWRAELGLVWTADGSTEGPPSLLFSREQVWSGQQRSARVRSGEASFG